MSRDPQNAFHTRKHSAKIACKVAMQARGPDAVGITQAVKSNQLNAMMV
jgi:hypothetical protein